MSIVVITQCHFLFTLNEFARHYSLSVSSMLVEWQVRRCIYTHRPCSIATADSNYMHRMLLLFHFSSFWHWSIRFSVGSFIENSYDIVQSYDKVSTVHLSSNTSIRSSLFQIVDIFLLFFALILSSSCFFPLISWCIFKQLVDFLLC